jgi:hypothetical protein
MERRPTPEFGKRRRPVDAPPSGPVKRSSHVALLLMGTFAVGGSAYALMPRENCQPPAPGVAAPAAPGVATPATSPAVANCGPRGSSWYGGHGWGGSSSSRSSFFSSDSASGRSSSGSFDASSSGVSRGGFGSFAHAFSAHFSGGG